jgi:hypothetical protein
MMRSATNLSNCPNCGATLAGPFCAQCGQKATQLNPSLRDILRDVVDEVLNVDSKILQSVRLLLTRPGFLSREQLMGRRIRHVSPIRLYLLCSVVYFGVAAFAPSATVRITVPPDQVDSPEEAARLEQRRAELQGAVNATISQWVPRALFVLVPLFAAFVALADRKSGRNYPQHLYFALHVHAAWFFAAALASAARIRTVPVVTTVVPVAASLYGILYLVLAFRATYNLTTAGAVLRAAAVGGGYAILMIAALVGIILLTIGRPTL